MELPFITYGCTSKFQTTYIVSQFKGASIPWWNTLGKKLRPDKSLQLTWEELLTHFKSRLCSAKNILELENQLLTLKKGSMIIDSYTHDFTEKNRIFLVCGPQRII